VPVAVSDVDEAIVVLSGVPAKSTCAPLTNPFPVTLSVNAPGAKLEGLTVLIEGVGFSSVTLLVPIMLVFAALTAPIVIVFGLGTAGGAV
jgi:hypothetical protein